VAASDTDIVPIVRVQPQYPLRAAERGTEGWVEVEFTISAAGTVKDPVVLNYHPSTIFNRAAVKAIRKWKYNPKIEDGQPVERPGVKVRLSFQLDK
jgi:protein TonB